MEKQCIGKKREAEVCNNMKNLGQRGGKDKMKGKGGLRGVRELNTKGDNRAEKGEHKIAEDRGIKQTGEERKKESRERQ